MYVHPAPYILHTLISLFLKTASSTKSWQLETCFWDWNERKRTNTAKQRDDLKASGTASYYWLPIPIPSMYSGTPSLPGGLGVIGSRLRFSFRDTQITTPDDTPHSAFSLLSVPTLFLFLVRLRPFSIFLIIFPWKSSLLHPYLQSTEYIRMLTYPLPTDSIAALRCAQICGLSWKWGLWREEI